MAPTHLEPNLLEAVVAAWLKQYASAQTRSAYRTDVDHFGAWARSEQVNPFAVSPDELRRYRAACENRGAAPATVARRLSAIASFGAFAHAQGAGLPAPRIERPALAPSSTTEPLNDDQAAALVAAADRMNRRSGVLVRLLMLDGLKASEAVIADACDLQGRPPRLTLTVRTRMQRVIELHPDTARLLAAYLGQRRNGPMLLSDHRARVTERLTRYGVDYIVKQAADAAHITGAVSANTLRRRFLMHAHDRGDHIDGIRSSAGHADARTTRRYFRTTSTAGTDLPSPSPT